jgi:hypothetical protein
MAGGAGWDCAAGHAASAGTNTSPQGTCRPYTTQPQPGQKNHNRHNHHQAGNSPLRPHQHVGIAWVRHRHTGLRAGREFIPGRLAAHSPFAGVVTRLRKEVDIRRVFSDSRILKKSLNCWSHGWCSTSATATATIPAAAVPPSPTTTATAQQYQHEAALQNAARQEAAAFNRYSRRRRLFLPGLSLGRLTS